MSHHNEHLGYCFRCRRKVEILEAAEVRLANGRPAVRGRCALCNAQVVKTLSKAA